MANEITVTQKLVVENGEFSENISEVGQRFTQAAIGGHGPVLSIGTSEEDFPVGDVTVLGWLYLKNLDSTNYVTYGPKSGGAMVAFGRLEAGESALLRLEPGITIRGLANTAACKVKMLLLQD